MQTMVPAVCTTVEWCYYYVIRCSFRHLLLEKLILAGGGVMFSHQVLHQVNLTYLALSCWNASSCQEVEWCSVTRCCTR
jgi:hypothetical protein